MSESCEYDNNCASCPEDCADRQAPQDFKKSLNEMSSVDHVIAVISGKGGVGKSLVTSLMAVISQRRGNRTAILDADVTGPSIPKTFKVTEKATANDVMIFPVTTKTGIQLMSVNLLLEDETDPVVWRGPVIAGTVEQFWTDVFWDGVDYMFVDMPPGTGDVPLTVFQSLPVDGIIVVASPQELVGMIVEKAVKMAELMKIPVLGIVENMSYFECPECHTRHNIFGESHVDEIAQKFGIDNVARIPVDPKLAAAVDAGMIELFDGDWLDTFTDNIEKKLEAAGNAGEKGQDK
ncbi:MAG: P-loop NTPase [Anaerovoracaceae bacterium]|jgi:Mrp family chromosome partitioning ATPase